jgi:hypothetical protein
MVADMFDWPVLRNHDSCSVTGRGLCANKVSTAVANRPPGCQRKPMLVVADKPFEVLCIPPLSRSSKHVGERR